MISTFNCTPETRSKHARPVCVFHDMLWSRVSSCGLLALEEVVSVPDICNVLSRLFLRGQTKIRKRRTEPIRWLSRSPSLNRLGSELRFRSSLTEIRFPFRAICRVAYTLLFPLSALSSICSIGSSFYSNSKPIVVHSFLVDANQTKSEIRTHTAVVAWRPHASSSIFREYVLVRDRAINLFNLSRWSWLIRTKLYPLGTVHAPLFGCRLNIVTIRNTWRPHAIDSPTFYAPTLFFCRLSFCLWGSAHINSNLDGASRWVRAFANQKGEKPILQSSEVSQDNKTIGLMGQACYQAVSGNQSWKREGLVLS